MQRQREIQGLKVRQWLSSWDNIGCDPQQRRSPPQRWFYQFSINAADLKALCGVYARTPKRSRAAHDLGIQRQHDQERSKEIARFIQYGFPWSDLSRKKRESAEFADLQKPGWLPTAIVVNVLTSKQERQGMRVERSDLVAIEDTSDGRAKLVLPKGYSGPNWRYKALPPIEVIDGQHRLWAFDEPILDGAFELPVVAFFGLDLSWQAYLFYTINIKPKKINASLAFDLYPLLRTEEWLEKFEGHVVYRETRAQELVDLLWSHPLSPWHHRINMLGEQGFKGLMVTQASWIRSLLASFVKSWEGKGVSIGGLYGAPIGENKLVLPWSRLEQAAFLIVFGQLLRDGVAKSKGPWVQQLRELQSPAPTTTANDKAFYGPHSLLNQDQGVRALLQVCNDVCYVSAKDVSLANWGGEPQSAKSDIDSVNQAITSLRKTKAIIAFLTTLATVLAAFDWRASGTPGLPDNLALQKAAFRGSGGYKELRRHLLRHVSANRSDVGRAARLVQAALGY